MYSKYEGVIILSICGKDGEDHVVQLGFALVPQENKYYWLAGNLQRNIS
jgi:hypothetical protein